MIKSFRQLPLAVVFGGAILTANVMMAPTPPTIAPSTPTVETTIARPVVNDPVVARQDLSALRWGSVTDF